jgi:hypothetical protein
VKICDTYKEMLSRWSSGLKAYGLTLGGPGILAASPDEVQQHPQVKGRLSSHGLASAQELAGEISRQTARFIAAIGRKIEDWRRDGAVSSTKADEAGEAIGNYLMFLRELSTGCQALFTPTGVAVSYAGGDLGATILRHDVLGIAQPLREMLWNRAPYACLSATLALDGSFEFFRRSTGVEPDFEEILPSPFDFRSQAAVYLPPPTRVPDPAEARKTKTEDAYFQALARELEKIITAVGGRTLALFHSRREMESVRMLINLPADLPIFMQRQSGAASTGERFIRETNSSLFAVRSFWTGFDAPGDTLSCVCLVRVPFEVPIDPPQVARLAWLQTQGLDAFNAHTLPLAKMLMRQGAGRLIRRAEDKGVIAILDPRVRSKRYGDEILANLPHGMRTFDDIYDAVAHVGITPEKPASALA